jgi:hypothetical protein
VTGVEILQGINIVVNSFQLMFLAYLTAKYRQNGGSSS